MIIEKRDDTLRYPRAIKDEKIRLVLDWLLEFRFSSINVLAARLGQTPVNANRFFNSLIDDSLIQVFQNVHTKHHRYVMLAAPGVSYLEAYGRDISRAVTRVANLGRYSQIVHDLSVQVAVLKRLSSYKEVIWDRNITFGSQYDRPDAILLAEKDASDYWSALEFERWRKDSKRIYMSFYHHKKNFDNKYYAGVYFIFQSKADCDHYKKLFEQKEWPLFERKSKSGQINRIKDTFLPDSVPNLRKRFVFLHEPVKI